MNPHWITLPGPVLEGDVIRLEPMTPNHLDALCAIGLEADLWRSTTIQVRSRTDMKAYVDKALAAQRHDEVLPFVIVHRDTGAVIGSTRFHTLVPEDRRVEIGFTWVALPWQRKAVNTEAKLLTLRHAFETMECLRVEFRADSENERSHQALESIGARLEGILRQHRVTAHRGVRDLAVYSIIASEWPAVRSSLEAKLRR